MKKTICILAFLVPFVSVAESAYERCKGPASLARTTMEIRQSGVSMREMMGTLSEAGELNGATELIIRLAFDRPLMRSDQNKAREISEFESEILAKCLDHHSPLKR